MKEVGLFINLYQPPTKDESAFRKVVNDRYTPLIKLIKSKKELRASLCIPLSTLELMDIYGYQSLISDLKVLYETDRIELVGTSAYHAVLTDLPEEMVENQIILNEYGLGYYLGARQGFEGEPSVMIRDLKVFYPPDFIVNEKVLKIVEDLGYKYIFLNDRSLEILYVDMNKKSYEDVEEAIKGFENDSVRIRKASDLLATRATQDPQTISASITQKYDKAGDIGKLLNNIEDMLITAYISKNTAFNLSDFEALPIWKKKAVDKVEDALVYNRVSSFVNLSKFLCNEKYKYDKSSSGGFMIHKYINLASEALKYLGDEKVTAEASFELKKLQDLLN